MSLPKTFRLVHLLDDRNPSVPAGKPVYTVCGCVVPALEPGIKPRPGIEAVRHPDAVTCTECRRGPHEYKWFRVIIIDPPGIQSEAARTTREAWESVHAALDGPSSWTAMTVQATTRRAAAEANPRSPFIGIQWYPFGTWLQGRILGRIGRGRWKLLPNW